METFAIVVATVVATIVAIVIVAITILAVNFRRERTNFINAMRENEEFSKRLPRKLLEENLPFSTSTLSDELKNLLLRLICGTLSQMSISEMKRRQGETLKIYACQCYSHTDCKYHQKLVLGFDYPRYRFDPLMSHNGAWYCIEINRSELLELISISKEIELSCPVDYRPRRYYRETDGWISDINKNLRETQSEWWERYWKEVAEIDPNFHSHHKPHRADEELLPSGNNRLLTRFLA